MPEPTAAPALRWIATCPDDTKEALAGELRALGVLEPRLLYRGVAFAAPLEVAYRAHLWLRTASRIQRVLGEAPSANVEELEAAAALVRWPDHLMARVPYKIATILTDADARALGEEAVQAAVARAVQRSFLSAGPTTLSAGPTALSGGLTTLSGGLTTPRLDAEADDAVEVVAHVKAGVCTLQLDTAGRALHKRGYRLNGHPAVLKETLAAAILLMSGYDGREALFDPMCGSGTLAIEAAYIALDKAPLIHRGKDDFGFERQAGFDRQLWRRVQDEARARKLPAPRAPIFASDLRADFVELARKTALRARVERHIHFSAGALQTQKPPAERGLLVANLPYGERIGRALPELYRDVGAALRGPFARWRAALLVPADGPLAALGRKPARALPLMNGALEVQLLLFDPVS